MKLTETTFIVTDTETTGLDTEKDRIVEYGLLRTSMQHGTLDSYIEELIDPGISIPPITSAIHHIVDKDVENCNSIYRQAPLIDDFCGLDDKIMVAHNAEYDKRMYSPILDHKKWICTKRIAQKLYPDAPSFGNQVIRYYLKLVVDLQGSIPHRVKADIIVTSALLKMEITDYLKLGYEDDIDLFLKWESDPTLIKVMPFGKHKGVEFKKIPLNYIQWMSRNMDMDRDLEYTVECLLNRRS